MKRLSIAAVGLALVVGVIVGAGPTGAAFPGANGKIAFTSDRDGGGNNEIYSMNPDGSDQTDLTNNPALDQDAAWSPDGLQIAFSSNRDGGWEIYRMNADGSCQTRVTPLSLEVNKVNPTWSPDGTKIAFQTFGPGDFEIYSIKLDGTELANLTEYPSADDVEPAWSPDGSQIAFRSDRNGPWEIHLMDANGNSQTRLKSSVLGDIEPAWSPDASWIAFRGSDAGHADIWKVNVADPGQLVNLTPTGGTTDEGPAWSPDGAKIAFLSTRDDGVGDIYTMSQSGGPPTRLTDNPAFDGFPAWQPLVDDPIVPPLDCGVGGIAELPDIGRTPLKAPDSSGRDATFPAGVAMAAGVIALAGGAWYARRRWVR